MTSIIRKKRLANKRRGLRTWTFSFWYKQSGENWKYYAKTIRSVSPPFKDCVIPIEYYADKLVMYPILEPNEYDSNRG